MSELTGASLLVEIGTEELPPKALRRLGEEFAAGCHAALKKVQLVTEQSSFRWFATPRRLAVWVSDVETRQPDQTVERRGPSLAAAFDGEGNPTNAALGFATSCGTDVGALERVQTEKGEWLIHRRLTKGESAHTLIPSCIERALKQLPIPKRMRWGNLESEFVRPVHWLVVLHGDGTIETEILSVRSGATTRGHRFLCREPLHLSRADDYERVLLEQGAVVPDFEVRKLRIEQQVYELARENNGNIHPDDDLMEQVTGLVEWPTALIGRFDSEFLEMPPEVLVSSMRDHQKYFSVYGKEGNLLPCFITVSNIEASPPDRIRQGNERVLRARLDDARFFWDSDRSTTLEAHGTRLGQVLFHRKLGTMADKVERLKHLARAFAPGAGADTARCVRAAQLIKADLVTDMVGEFPDLQGVMGSYYARNDGEPEEVARACSDHYLPRVSGDSLPCTPVATVLALVDRIDSLIGIFGAGEEPTGDKDPFALRRAALGVLRLLIERKLDIGLRALLDEAAAAYRTSGAIEDCDSRTVDRVLEFINDRLRSYYLDQGFGADEIASVAAGNPPKPLDFDLRLRAVAKFRMLESASNLAAANKRICNILRKAEDQVPDDFDLRLVVDDAEKNLANRLLELDKDIHGDFEAFRYEAGLEQLASLREPVDRFFDEVMVMVDEEALRKNRLALLRRLHQMFLKVADISLLQESPGR